MLVRWCAVLFLVLLASGPSTASGESKVVHDQEDGYEAYFLAIQKVRFTNASAGIRMHAVHRTLVPAYVDRFELWLRNGKNRPSVEQDRYVLRRTGGHLRLLRQSPGQETPSRVTCRGDRMRVVAGSEERAGKVVAWIPRRCIARSGFLQFGYLVHNEGGNVTDIAPGARSCCVPQMTRWLRRG